MLIPLSHTSQSSPHLFEELGSEIGMMWLLPSQTANLMVDKDRTLQIPEDPVRAAGALSEETAQLM